MLKSYISLSVIALLISSQGHVEGHRITNKHRIHHTTEEEKDTMDMESALSDENEALQTGQKIKQALAELKNYDSEDKTLIKEYKN